MVICKKVVKKLVKDINDLDPIISWWGVNDFVKPPDNLKIENNNTS